MANNQLAKQRMEELQARVPEEKEWWDMRKKGISEGFMKELDAEKAATVSASEKKGSVSSQGGQRRVSDDDAVIVESGGPTEQGGTPTSTPGNTPGKKKKGKK